MKIKQQFSDYIQKVEQTLSPIALKIQEIGILSNDNKQMKQEFTTYSTD